MEAKEDLEAMREENRKEYSQREELQLREIEELEAQNERLFSCHRREGGKSLEMLRRINDQLQRYKRSLINNNKDN